MACDRHSIHHYSMIDMKIKRDKAYGAFRSVQASVPGANRASVERVSGECRESAGAVSMRIQARIFGLFIYIYAFISHLYARLFLPAVRGV